MQCNICNTDMVEFNLIYENFYYCSNCDKSIVIKTNSCCNLPNLQYRKSITQNGNFQLYKQCLNCGYVPRRLYKFKNDNNINIDEIQLLDKLRSDAAISNQIDSMKNMSLTISNIKKTLFFSKLNQYYNTDKWKLKREKVLKRDNFLCQACLNKKAIQVHHLTYKHVFDEPLFELVSICIACHTKITLMDQ